MSLVQLVAFRLSHHQGPSLAAVTALWLHVRGSTHSNARTEHAVLLSDLYSCKQKAASVLLLQGQVVDCIRLHVLWSIWCSALVTNLCFSWLQEQ